MSSEVLAMAASVLPVVIVLVIGRLITLAGLLTPVGASDLNRVVYWIGLPAQLFVVVARSDPRQAFELSAAMAAVVGFCVALVVSLLATRRLDPAARGSIASGVARSNAAYVGLPVVMLAAQTLGEERGGQLNAVYPVLLALMVPIFNIGTVIAFVVPQHGLNRRGLQRSVAQLPKNPLIIACLAGLACAYFTPGILHGTVVESSLNLLAASSLPLALLVTGAALDLSRIRAAPGLLIAAAVGKLLIVPGIVAGLAWLAGASQVGLAAATVLMACPTAVANTPMARQLGGDEALMAAQVVLTTIISPITLVLWMVVLL